MKIKFLLIVISALAFASCSTVYKSGQTPDDVYYSSAKVVVEKTNHHEDREVRNTDYEEREIRMGTYDRRWRYINDDYNYGYSYNPYQYGYSYGYYYNPYYYPCPVYISNVAIRNPKNTTPRMTGLSSYTNTNTTVNSFGKYGTPTRNNTIRAYNNSNNSRTGNTARRSTYQPNTTQQNTTDNNSRSYTPSTNNSSSSSGSSSGSISRPARKN